MIKYPVYFHISGGSYKKKERDIGNGITYYCYFCNPPHNGEHKLCIINNEIQDTIIVNDEEKLKDILVLMEVNGPEIFQTIDFPYQKPKTILELLNDRE